MAYWKNGLLAALAVVVLSGCVAVPHHGHRYSKSREVHHVHIHERPRHDHIHVHRHGVGKNVHRHGVHRNVHRRDHADVRSRGTHAHRQDRHRDSKSRHERSGQGRR